MGRLLALLPVIGLTVLLLAWASAPAVDAMAPTVAAGAADGLRSIGVGCGVALVVLAAGATAIGLLITATTRADRQWVRYVEAPPARPALPPTQAIEPSYYVVKESEYVE
jgi:hypothetical protein